MFLTLLLFLFCSHWFCEWCFAVISCGGGVLVFGFSGYGCLLGFFCFFWVLAAFFWCFCIVFWVVVFVCSSYFSCVWLYYGFALSSRFSVLALVGEFSGYFVFAFLFVGVFYFTFRVVVGVGL